MWENTERKIPGSAADDEEAIQSEAQGAEDRTSAPTESTLARGWKIAQDGSEGVLPVPRSTWEFPDTLGTPLPGRETLVSYAQATEPALKTDMGADGANH